MSGNILPIFIPFLGCDNRCIFCNQEAITKIELSNNLLDNINNQYEKYISLASKFDEIAFYGGNFGALKKDVRMNLYDFAVSKNFKKIRYSTRVDTVTDELLQEAKRYNISLIELGVQSLNDQVLALNLRPYKSDDVFYAIEKVASVTNCGVQMMIGMYGQDILSSIDDAKIISQKNIKTVRIYPTVVIKNTALEKLFYDKKYQPLDFTDALITSAVTYIIYSANGVKVIRLSLPDDLDSGDNILGGLYHASYGDIVRSVIVMLYLDLGKNIVGSRDKIYYFSGYKGMVREHYAGQFIEDDNADTITFDEMIKTVYEGYGYFKDSSRAFKGKAADVTKKIRY